MMHPEHTETARTKEISVAESHGQLHIAVGYEGDDGVPGEDYILLDVDRVPELMDRLAPWA